MWIGAVVDGLILVGIAVGFGYLLGRQGSSRELAQRSQGWRPACLSPRSLLGRRHSNWDRRFGW